VAPRLRFAPSPTGYLHIGSARTVLFNWLYARHTGGELLLRIEDTDTERNKPELTDEILAMVQWLGLGWDGDAVHQSDRFDRHREVAAALLAAGKAYWCDCTADDVKARNEAAGGKPGYDGFCRDRGIERSDKTALRFRAPDDGVTAWDDIVRGKVSFENSDIEDFVLLRSNGTPIFLLAVTVDDADMAITHVVRSEEHINGTPKYLLIAEAAGFERPVFAHVPIVVNDQRKKLSKRRDDVSVADYKRQGFLPEAMRNYLALLGWGPPDAVEVRPIDEMIELFDLDDVNSSPAAFDVKKLEHVNGEWIRRLDVDDFVQRSIEFLPPGDAPLAALRSIAPLVQERVRRLDEVARYVDFLHLAEPIIDEAAFGKAIERYDAAPAVLDDAMAALTDAPFDDPEALHGLIDGIAEARGENPRKVHAVVRVAITGRQVGPPLFESLVALGRERTLERLRAARTRL
jgi:glutamyl-tRNA synthetase